MLHSIYDLTTSCRKTTGDVPAKLVGASTTVVGSKMYLFGGRLVAERRMVSDLYCFDLQSFVWERISSFPEDDVPRPRYFHSADAWNNQLIIFGGMSNQPDSPNPEELSVLNDVRFFDLATRHWLPSTPTPPSTSAESLAPRARYAHLSSITADRLFIIGGQDFFNTWLDDVCVYDLLGKAWVQRRDYPRHCGTYRSVAVASSLTVRLPHEESQASSSSLGVPGTRFQEDKFPPPTPEFTSTDSLIHLPYSTTPTEDHPADIFLYSNYNFTDVKRELEVFSPLPDTDFTVQDRSAAMSGTTFPPGLRFPTGAILGNHLIIAGTYLAHNYQSYSIWVLDLTAMTWSRIDPGKAVENGSWFRGCLWVDANKFMIFGNRNGNLVDDYNRRLLSWDHVAVVDLEAFGIYQPPPPRLDVTMQELGLAALEERILADFEIICDDGRKIGCSRKTLEERWPWFKDQRRKLLETALSTSQALPTSPMHVALPELPGSSSADEVRPDPRLTPRALHLSEPYPITMALLQYFYSLALITPLQHAPAVLSQLLILSTNYHIPHLESLVKHAMHRALSNSTSVGVYEVATLCSCRSLQIRALKTVMSYTQKRPSKSKNEKDSGGGGRPPDGGSGGGPSNGSNGPPGPDKSISRPRGTSDARWRTTVVGGDGINNSTYNSRRQTPPARQAPGHQPGAPSQSDVDPSSEDQVSSLPLFTKAAHRHNRRVSAVSLRTDQELHAVADLLMPPPQGQRRAHGRTRSIGVESTIPERSSYMSDCDSADEMADPRNLDESSYPPSQVDSASYVDSESEYELVSPNGQIEHVYLPSSPAVSLGGYSSAATSPGSGFSPPPTSPNAFHLPRRNVAPIQTSLPDRRQAFASDTSDTPSLVSATSYSSLSSSSRSFSGNTMSPQAHGNVYSPEYNSPTSPQRGIVEERRYDPHPSSGWVDALEERNAMLEFNFESKAPPKPNNPGPERPFSPATIMPEMSPVPESPMRSRGSSLNRFLGGSKQDKTGELAREFSRSPLPPPMDAKAFKAEEKKRKKAEEKARKEKLAYDLKERARKRAASDTNSSKSNEKPKEIASMYGMAETHITM